MNWINKLRSLPEKEQKEEIKRRIQSAQEGLINDRARIDLLNDDEMDCWNEVDDVEVEEFQIDENERKCTSKFIWTSYGPHDEDDERVLYGWATAVIDDGCVVSFTDTHVKLEGSRPKRPEGSSASDVWWDGLDQNDRQGRIDDMNKD